MIERVIIAIIVGVVTGILVYIVGAVLIAVDLDDIGSVVEKFAPLLGLLAGVFYFITGHRAV